MGDPREELVNFAKEEKVDIIFCGSRSLTGLAKKFIGSTSDYLVHYAPCSVFVHKR